MQLYNDIDVDMTFQDFGTSWLVILRGAKPQIESVFLGLWNHGATARELSYETEELATFWSTKKRMKRFLFNQTWHSRANKGADKGKKGGSFPPSEVIAEQKLAELISDNQEEFLTYGPKYAPETYSNGTICAERPDNDMKDAILANAFIDKTPDTTDNE